MSKDHIYLRRRAVAFMVDLVVVTIAQFTFGTMTLHFYAYLCDQMGTMPSYDTTLFLSQFCGGFFFVVYFTFSVGLFGNTWGKEIMGLKVVYHQDGKAHAPTLRQAYWRSMAYLMSSWTYMIGFILPYFRKDRLALHDLLCGSQVVTQAGSESENAQQLDLPYLATVHQIKTPTKEQEPPKAQIGTDR